MINADNNMTKASLMIVPRNSFNNIFINNENIGSCGCSRAYDDNSFRVGSLLTEIIYLNSTFDKYKDMVLDFRFYNECRMSFPIPYSNNKQEITQINEIISRCFSPVLIDKISIQTNSRSYFLRIHTYTKAYNALYRSNDNPLDPKQGKNILFKTQQGIGEYQKDYGLEIDDNTIFKELLDYVTTNEK